METRKLGQFRRGFLLLVIIYAIFLLLCLPLLLEHYSRLVFTPTAHPQTGSTIHYSEQVESMLVRSNRPRNHTPKTMGLHNGTTTGHDPTSPSPKMLQSKGKGRRSEQFGYILTFQYSGQQGAGINALISQQCWVESFKLPMLLVEPFVVNSHLGAHPESGNTTLKFSDYYDMEMYGQASIAEGYGHLASWEEFLDHAPQQIILIAMRMFTPRPAEENIRTFWKRKQGTGDCYTQNQFWLPRGLQYLQTSYKFCVMKIVICAYSSASPHIFNAAEMRQVIFGNWDPQQVTLMFSTWRGPWFVPNPSLPNPNVCSHAFNTSILADKMYSSPRLIQTAQEYERLYLKSKASVAVMLRTEHVIDALRPLLRQPNISVAVKYDCCLQDVLTKANRLRKGGAVFATVDVGKYGSRTWSIGMFRQILAQIGKDHVFQAAKDTVTKLLDNQMTFEEWENTFSKVTSGVEDRGYIAGLQKALASRADCLVLVGGGHFLRLALREYIHNHPHQSTWCIEVLCAIKSSTKQYRETLEKGRNRSNGNAHIHFVPW